MNIKEASRMWEELRLRNFPNIPVMSEEETLRLMSKATATFVRHRSKSKDETANQPSSPASPESGQTLS